MDRRKFILSSTGSVAAAAAGSGKEAAAAVEPLPDTVVVPPDDLDAYVAGIDQGMQRISRWTLKGAGAVDVASGVEIDQLARDALQSLFITGMLGDLPLQMQVDPRVQSRVLATQPVLDRAAEGMTAYLSAFSDQDLERASDRLRRPGVVARVIAELDTQAGLSHVSRARRRQFREQLDQVGWRLTHQPPALVVHEYLDKAKRSGRRILNDPDSLSPRAKRVRKAKRTAGIGAIIFGISGILVAAGAFPAVFGATVGAVFMIVGLFMLISAATLSSTVPDSTSRAR